MTGWTHIVECRNAVVVDAFVRADQNAGWNSPDCTGHRRHHNTAENGNGFVARHDEHGSALIIWGLEKPEFALGYQASASVMAIAFAMARSSSSADWGISRYEPAIDAPRSARRTASARRATACRTTADRLAPTPAATSSSSSWISSGLNLVGTGVVIRPSIQNVEHGGVGAGECSDCAQADRRVGWPSKPGVDGRR